MADQDFRLPYIQLQAIVAAILAAGTAHGKSEQEAVKSYERIFKDITSSLYPND